MYSGMCACMFACMRAFMHACMHAGCVYSGTVRCRYSAVNFLTIIHKRKLIEVWGVFPLSAWRGNGVVVASKRRNFDVTTSKWRRFDVVAMSLLRGVSPGFCGTTI